MEHLEEKSGSRAALLIALFGFLALVAIDTVLAKSSFIMPFNLAVFSAVDGLRLAVPWLTNVMIGVTLLGSDPVLFALVIVLVVCYRHRWRARETTWFLLVAVSGRIIVLLAKAVVKSPRPDLFEAPAPFYQFSGYGYPSGHALMSTVALGAAALLAVRYMRSPVKRRAVVAVCVFLILAIGFSRIILGAHWHNDVVGGYLYGICILLGGQLLRRRIVTEGPPVE